MKKIRLIKISDIFDDWFPNTDVYGQDFLFARFQTYYSQAYSDLDLGIGSRITPKDLDFKLITDIYDKYASPVLVNWYNKYHEDSDRGRVSTLNRLIDMIYDRYYPNWYYLHESLYADYNPIHNYNMDEHEDINSKITNTNEGINNNFGFNTTSDTGVGNEYSNNEITTEGLAKDNYRDLKRSGNIGVTTTQKMVEQEIELRKHKYLDLIFADIIDLLTLDIY